MDFYSVHEETPLLLSNLQETSSPARSEAHESPLDDHSSSTQSLSGGSRRGNNHTEVELSLDKVSFIYSPKSPARNSFQHPSSQSVDDALSILDPYFDVTVGRLRAAFEEALPDNVTDAISYDGFKVAMESMGIRCTNDAAFLKLVGSIDREGRQCVSFEQFDAAVHKLKLVHLFEDATVARMTPSAYHAASIAVVDFSNTRLQQFSLQSHEFAEFFTSSRPSWVSMRWINVNGHDSLNLKRLAIKYRLHPLAVEDTLEMHERPKFDRYDGHLFLVFPVLRMEVFHERFPFCQHSQQKRTRTRTRSRSVTNLLKMDSMKSMSGEKGEDPFKLWIEHVAIFVVGNNTVITVKDGDQSMWSDLSRRLTVPYSKLRHNDAKFLTYAVLDVIVDQITNVVDSITESLVELEDELARLQHHFDIGRLRFLKNELFRLPRLLKPAREVLKNLIESKDFDSTVTAYIRDVQDHTVQVLDDIELQLQMCRLLSEDYRDAKANQMNYVIYTLTIITTVFLPAQFLTGVYGMNFDNMPELHSHYGYYMFWFFVLSIAVSLQLYFRYKKWI